MHVYPVPAAQPRGRGPVTHSTCTVEYSPYANICPSYCADTRMKGGHFLHAHDLTHHERHRVHDCCCVTVQVFPLRWNVEMWDLESHVLYSTGMLVFNHSYVHVHQLRLRTTHYRFCILYSVFIRTGQARGGRRTGPPRARSAYTYASLDAAHRPRSGCVRAMAFCENLDRSGAVRARRVLCFPCVLRLYPFG